jgi:ornithine cyclodeaminase
LHALGGVIPGAELAGTKTWAHTRGGAAPLLILFDTRDGSVRALVEAFALGQLRTGAVAGVATRWLARADADELALIGTGKQARAQVEAVAHVRRLRRVRVFSPTAAHRAGFVRELARVVDAVVEEAASAAAAVAGAPIVTLATRATTPVLQADMIAPGTHINAIGAITPERVELADDVLASSHRIVVDSLSAARQLSRELQTYCAARPAEWDRVIPLCQLIANPSARGTAEVTLFKAMGMGLCDVALGIEVYRRHGNVE